MAAGALSVAQVVGIPAGLRLALEASASGWAVRHRKARVDHDLASTQGRFADHKHLYKDRLLSSLVIPFFVRGQVAGTDPQAAGQMRVRALAPLAELTTYQSRLNALTSGQGRYTVALSHYEAVPPQVQQLLTSQHRLAPDD